MVKISLIRLTNLASVDYAYASCIPSGMDIFFMAGACPLNKEGIVLGINNYEFQAKLCVENLVEALRGFGASLKDITYTRVLVASSSRADLVSAWRAIREEFGENDVPSTLLGVTVLGYEKQLVEIEAVVALEKK
ncbi:RidA family protein [Cohnella herbarum]|uniref:RidA family protein n=1 Tax=Cohnella herbarum TaxID=2728023 RepID=A0A7Z2VSQ3_9BACL|nr:Rid family hydrolase [Cohnella herbarum]QJD83270.1 RidA family protein [Cohnella herbarum]QJD88501.1 RidA family protein [Cohnella herbarum]